MRRGVPVEAGGLSATAVLVAAARALETRRPHPLVVDPYAQAFVDTAGLDLNLPGTPSATRESTTAWEHLATYIGIRSRFFDSFCTTFTREFPAVGPRGSGRQVVILAAGLDTRSHRLTWTIPDIPGGVTVFEVDQAEVLTFKDDVLADTCPPPGISRVPVPADLCQDWPAALTAAGFDPKQPTAWLAEGLLPYLPATAETLLFNRIHQLSAPGSRIAIEHWTLAHTDFTTDPDLSAFASQFGMPTGHLFPLDTRDHPPQTQLAHLGWTPLHVTGPDLATTYRRAFPNTFNTLIRRVTLIEARTTN